nr:NAC domain-containing protein [Tanacetum cinerariifolium]
MTNLHSILLISNNSLTVVRSVKVPIIALIVEPGTSLCMSLLLKFKDQFPGRRTWGSNDFTEVPFNDGQILRQHNTAHVTPPPLAYTPPQPLPLSELKRRELITYMIESQERFDKTQEQIMINQEKGSDKGDNKIDSLTMAPFDTFLMGDKVTYVYDDLECSIPLDSPPSLILNVLGERKVDIDLDTLSTGDTEIDFNPTDIETIDLIPVPWSRPPESTPVIDESSLLVTPPPASKQLSLREVERFDLFFSLTQSGEEPRAMEIPSFGFHHIPSSRPAAYSPKKVMYRFYHPRLTSGDVFDPESKSK